MGNRWTLTQSRLCGFLKELKNRLSIFPRAELDYLNEPKHRKHQLLKKRKDPTTLKNLRILLDSKLEQQILLILSFKAIFQNNF